MPVEPSPYWQPLLWVSGSIVAIGAVWFTRFVVDRLDKDRSKIHDHATKLQVHDLLHEEHKEEIKALKERKW